MAASVESMLLMAIMVGLVGSSDLNLAQMPLQMAPPKGRPVSVISLPTQYITTQGWLKSLLTMLSTSFCHSASKCRA